MSEPNGVNRQIHMFQPSGLIPLPATPIIVPAEDFEYVCYLFPFEHACRDTKLNQITWYLEALLEPLGTIEAKVALYRDEGSLTDPVSVPGGRIVYRKVPETEVVVIGTGAVLKTKWVFPKGAVDIQGGGYNLVIAVKLVNLERDPVVGTLNFVGINDADPLRIYPKYDVALVAPITLPATINLPALTAKTDNWHYASTEEY